MALMCVYFIPVLFSRLVSSFEVLDGCKVTDRIDQDVSLSDSMEFFMLSGTKSDLKMNVILKCEHNHIISINMTDSQFEVHEKSLNIDKKNRTHFTGKEVKGWLKFTLDFSGNITLYDEENHPWLSLQTHCSGVKNVLIKDGNFTKLCPSQTPTWLIGGNQRIEVPMQMGSQKTSFFSRKNYSASLDVSGVTLLLGRNLRNFKQFVLSLEEHGSTYTIKVLNEDLREMQRKSFKERPTVMNVFGQENDDFLFVQHVKLENEMKGWSFLTIFLGVILGGIIVLLALSAYLLAFFNISVYTDKRQSSEQWQRTTASPPMTRRTLVL